MRKRRIKFETYKRGKHFRWRLRAANGEIIAHGEGYNSRYSRDHVIGIIKKHASRALTVEV